MKIVIFWPFDLYIFQDNRNTFKWSSVFFLCFILIDFITIVSAFERLESSKNAENLGDLCLILKCSTFDLLTSISSIFDNFSRLHFTLFFVYLERNEHCFACTIMEMANQTLKMVQCCDCHIHISLNAIFRDFSKTNQRITKTKIPLDLSLRVGHVDMQHVYICIILIFDLLTFWPFDLCIYAPG